MWYFKKTAQSVWNASKGLLDNRSPIQKLIDQIVNSQQQIISTNNLNKLSSMTYESEYFEQITTTIENKLKKFHYDIEESQKSLNMLVATNYLIKHGATGFVDQFRSYLNMFKKYQGLESKVIYQNGAMQARLENNLEKIKSRAHHIWELLSNKDKLLKEKQLSMLVKQKLKLYQQDRTSALQKENYSDLKQRQSNKNITREQYKNSTASKIQSTVKNIGNRAQNIWNNSEEYSSKLDGLLQNYLWKYVDKVDESIESAANRVMHQVDKYVNGEQTQFELEDEEEQKQQGESAKKLSEDDDDDFIKKLEKESGEVPNNSNFDNLLEFDEVEPVKKGYSHIEDLM